MKKIFLSEPIFDKKEINSAISSIKNLRLSQGKKVIEFENSFAKYIGCKYGIATNSGSSANLIALTALKEYYNIKDGSEVIIPASTFATVAMPIIQIGLVPVYVDINISNLNIETREILKAITKKTKIIMPVHTLGYPANMNKINTIAKKNNLIVFEDCCEAHGSAINKKRVGSFSEISAFSFFVAHNITTGEGGMILTKNKKLMEICKSLREFGRIDQSNVSSKKNRFYSDNVLKNYDKRYVFERMGYNMRMTDIAASFGVEQVKKLSNFNKKRVNNANFLIKKLNRKFSNYFDFTQPNRNEYHSYYTFPVVIKNPKLVNRFKIVQYLEENGIETRPLFAGCLPDQPAFKKSPGRIVGNLINSRYARDNVFFFGIHPGISKSDLNYICACFDKYMKNIINDSDKNQ